jgi:membrane fusion protein (multidrug efflux system)
MEEPLISNSSVSNNTEPDFIPPTPKKRGQNRYKTLGIILVIFAVLATAGIFWWMHKAGFEDTDDAFITAHIHPVNPKVGGTIQKILVDNNQIVKAGQLLAVIDPEDYEIALRQAAHNLLIAKAQAETAKANIPFAQQQAAAQVAQAQGGIGISQSGVTQSQQAVSESRAEVATAQQTVLQQQANYQNAQLNYQRYAGANPEAVSVQQLDTARTNLRVAEAALKAARAQVNQARARLAQAQSNVSTSSSKVSQSQGIAQGATAQRLQVNVVKNQYQSAVASIGTAQDAVDQAKLNLSYTRIVAPVSGRVGQRTAEVGQRVQPGEPLMAVVNPDIWVVANFKETQLRRMKPGQPVEISVDAFPDHTFQGYIDSISPASGAQFALLPPENATGNYTKTVQRVPVKIVFDPKGIHGYENLLVPGLSVVPKVNVNVEPKRRGS